MKKFLAIFVALFCFAGLSFADEIDEDKPLASVIDIESYKNYNYIFGMPKEDTINKNISTNCQCCILF